jgi:hypothetical protein
MRSADYYRYRDALEKSKGAKASAETIVMVDRVHTRVTAS